MNIQGADLPSGSKTDSGRQIQTNTVPKPMPDGQVPKAADRAAFFMENGLDLPESTLRSLEQELAGIGLSVKDLDSGSILRALTMSANRIPPDRALITGDIVYEQPLPLQLDQLVSDIQALIDSSVLHAETKTLLENAAAALTSLINGGETPVAAVLTAGQAIDMWILEMDNLLRAALSGKGQDAGRMPDANASRSLLTALMQDAIPLTDDGNGKETDSSGRFRELSAGFKRDILALIQSGRLNAENLEKAGSALSAKLNELLTDSGPAISGRAMQQLAATDMSTLVENGLKTIMLRLASLADNEANGKKTIDGQRLFPQVKISAAQSGMQFEWRLLAWYRAGRDPEVLKMLMNQDIKGVLLNVSRRLKSQKKQAGAEKALSKIAAQSDILAGNITRRQLYHILNDHEHGRLWMTDMFIDIDDAPPVTVTGSDRGKGQDKEQVRGPGRFSFTVETSRLGTVTAAFSVSGQALGLTLAFEDNVSAIAVSEWKDEIYSALQSRGFDNTSVSIITDKSRESSRPETEMKVSGGGKVDFSG